VTLPSSNPCPESTQSPGAADTGPVENTARQEGSEHKATSAGPGWFKAARGAEPLELIRRNPLAFVLAYIIAYRARWRDGFNEHGLGPGEAFIGDHAGCGITRQQYRTAMRQLAEWKFATFKPTNRGTVARLTDSRLFDVFPSVPNQQTSQRLTNSQPTANQRLTTNKEQKNVRTEEQKDLSIGTGAPAISRFSPPTIEQVKAECVRAGLPESEAERFFDHYEANGWKVGHNPMKSWPASLRNWKRNLDTGRYSPQASPQAQGHSRKWGQTE
jgi:hypothetical protein